MSHQTDRLDYFILRENKVALYLLSTCLILIFGILYLILKRTFGLRTRGNQLATNVDEKAPNLERQYVPGDSPAYYTGDPINDVLAVDALDLTPNPPLDQFVLELRGRITEEIGANPHIYVSVLVNGRPGPDQKTILSPFDDNFEIVQDGHSLVEYEVPRKGAVVMRYKNIIPYWWMCKGWYTVRSEMYASEEVGGLRLTGFEGAVWVEGEASDSDCNPSDSDSVQVVFDGSLVVVIILEELAAETDDISNTKLKVDRGINAF